MNEPSGKHRTVIVEVGDCKEAIDEALAPLITAIWQAGINTAMCCQETRPGIAWIEFESLDDLRDFVNIVAHYEDGVDTLYNRINYQMTGEMSAPEWEYQLNLTDLNECNSHEGATDIEFTVGVYFPISDISVILNRVCEAVGAHP
ncbi:MAG: hypothetical protein ABFD16_08460 [Thermoguttaceae bacterium]|jgi:predicted nucleotidyltransferase